ncbi:MAG: biotin/lipoyl-binding protein [Acidimicrobiales bacterium]
MTDSPTSDPRPRVASSTNERLVALFPEMSDGTVRRRPRRRWPAFAAVAVIAAGTATGVVATNASGSAATSYRTATVATHDVDAVLDAVATIEPVSQAAVAFPVAGTVSGVDVALGDTVSVGQRLATLDTTSLQATLHTRQAALAAAKLTLTKALESSAAAEAATTTTTSAARSATGATGSSGATGSTSLAPAQQKVIAAQRDVDTALAASATAAASSDTVCAGVTTVALTTAPGDAAALATTTTTTTTAPAAGTDALTACRQALATELAARTTLSTAQQTLSSAANALDAIIEQRAATTATTSAASTGTTTRSTSSSGSSSSTSPSGFSGGSPSSATPSTEDLIADQQAVDAAFAQVAVATQAIDQATIVSPIQGTVVAVALAAGGLGHGGLLHVDGHDRREQRPRLRDHPRRHRPHRGGEGGTDGVRHPERRRPPTRGRS